MKRHADVIILCEDRAHANFIRHYLKKRGFNNRKIRIMPRCSPASGAQFVEANYATQVKAYRSKANYLSVALLTVIDADTQAVEQIHERLEEQLQDAGLEQRKAEERIAVLVPKRNIETWIVYLLGITVNEETDYKKCRLAKDPQAPKQAGIALAEQFAQGPKGKCPQSLQAAWSELKDRLPG